MPRAPEPGLGWTRRELLLSAPALAAALGTGCRPGPPVAEAETRIDLSQIEGKIVGASAKLGHRLRDGDLPEPSELREVPVLIAGGGVAGLSAGWKLARSGFSDFVLLELEEEPGGNARWGENSVSAYPWGAHYLPQPTEDSAAVRELLEEMGLVLGQDASGQPIYDPRHLCHSPQERLFTDAGWQPGLSLTSIALPEDTAEVAAFEAQIQEFRAARGSDGRPPFTLPMALGSRDPRFRDLDNLSMRAFMDRQGWRSQRLRWYVDYCCRDDYGCTLDTTSAWAAWHYFCARDPGAEVLTWPEGNGRLVRHLEASLPTQIQTGQLVHRVHAAADRPQGVEVDVLDQRSQTTIRYRAQRLIFAMPRFLAPHLISGYRPQQAAGFTYSPWMVANLTLSRLPDEAAWDNVFYHSQSLGYVVATHQDLRMVTGPSVLTYYWPLTGPDPEAARRELQQTSWEEWSRRILLDLGQPHPGIEALVRRIDIMLWGHAMIRPTPGFLFSQARRDASRPFGAVTFAHSDMSGLSLFEEAQYRGIAAAELWLRDRGHPYSSSIRA